MNGTTLLLILAGVAVFAVIATSNRRKGQVWRALNAPVVQTGVLGVFLGLLAHGIGRGRKDPLGDAYERLIDAQDDADKAGARDFLSSQARDPRHNPRLARYQAPAPADPPPNG